MFTTWVVGTFLIGLAVEVWAVLWLIRFVRGAMVKAKAIMDAEARARVAAARQREVEALATGGALHVPDQPDWSDHDL